MKEILLNDNWLFHKENEVESCVTLPHTYNAVDGQSGISMWRGKGFYKKEVLFSEEDLKEKIFLEIGASAMKSTVYMNGKTICHNTCPYAMYRIALNEHITVGKNLLEIVTDNTATDEVYPQMADFSFYGGVYRDVKLVFVPQQLHFDYLDGSRDGVQVRTQKLDGQKWEVTVTGCVINEGKDCEGEVKVSVLDRQGVVLEKTLSMYFSEKQVFTIRTEIDQPHLWMGVEDPYLYQVQVEICTKDGVEETRSIATGFREITIDPEKGMFLNGKHIKIRGVARHQDFGGVGNAVSKEQMEEDLSLVKEVGANSVRLSHYQHDDYFYRRCDEEGILVWAEVPFISILSESEKADENIRQQMERLIKQCGNHISIYCWGVQNEITIAGETAEIHEKVKAMAAYTKQLDPSRYTAEANIYSVANESPLNRMADLVGYNLYYGWYYDKMTGLQQRLDEFHMACPDVPLLVTEYGVDTNPGYHSYEPKTKDYSEEYQLLFSENALKAFEERDYFVGSYVWNLCDFGSANRDEGGKQGQNQKGLVTIDRKIKKDAYYLYKANWSKESFVKLAGSRFVNRHQEENTITVLSNLKKLEVYVNGKLAGVKEQPEPMTNFTVVLPMGENKITAKGFDQTETVYEDEMVLHRVTEPDKSYEYVQKDQGGNVINWFEKFDLEDAGTEEIALNPECYSSMDKLGEIMKHPKGEAIILKYFGEMVDHPKFAMMKVMTLDAMSKLKNLGIPKELILVINRELQQIKK